MNLPEDLIGRPAASESRYRKPNYDDTARPGSVRNREIGFLAGHLLQRTAKKHKRQEVHGSRTSSGHLWKNHMKFEQPPPELLFDGATGTRAILINSRLEQPLLRPQARNDGACSAQSEASSAGTKRISYKYRQLAVLPPPRSPLQRPKQRCRFRECPRLPPLTCSLANSPMHHVFRLLRQHGAKIKAERSRRTLRVWKLGESRARPDNLLTVAKTHFWKTFGAIMTLTRPKNPSFAQEVSKSKKARA